MTLMEFIDNHFSMCPERRQHLVAGEKLIEQAPDMFIISGWHAHVYHNGNNRDFLAGILMGYALRDERVTLSAIGVGPARRLDA